MAQLLPVPAAAVLALLPTRCPLGQAHSCYVVTEIVSVTEMVRL